MEKKHQIIAIAALGKETRAIGKNNDLLWSIPGDLPRFKEITTGHPIIMGYATFVSMGKRVLPNRTNIIMTLDPELSVEGALVAHSKEKALELAKQSVGSNKIFIIGGGQIYALMLPETDVLDLTLVDDDTKGDTFFPDYTEFSTMLAQEHHTSDDLHFSRIQLTRPQ